jgi:hypothetical protein
MLMLCPICSDEFQGRGLVCPTCDCWLVPASPIESTFADEETHPDYGVEFVELCRPRTHPVAMIVKEVLEHNGVATLVQGSNAMSVLPHLAFAGELRVMVARNQIDFARELYHAYFERDDDFVTDDLQ